MAQECQPGHYPPDVYTVRLMTAPPPPGALGNTKQSPLGVGPRRPAVFAAICLTFSGPLSPSVLVSLALSTPDNLHGQAGAALPLRLRVTLSVLWSCIPLLGRNSEDLLTPGARKPFPPASPDVTLVVVASDLHRVHMSVWTELRPHSCDMWPLPQGSKDWPSGSLVSNTLSSLWGDPNFLFFHPLFCTAHISVL